MITMGETLYERVALMADPIHNYIPFTVPHRKKNEVTEKEIIDSPWMQRLRYINQLQSARWVYPSAEHSRFIHSLGTMHVAGLFAKQIYPSLKEQYPNCPSFCYIESLLRLTGLVHDIGHGPFCHFFDDHFLKQHHLTHEIMGQYIILNELAPLLEQIERSVSGEFDPGEKINPNLIAYLISKAAPAAADEQLSSGAVSDPTSENNLAIEGKTTPASPDRPTAGTPAAGGLHPSPRPMPQWAIMLKPLFAGIFTVDNLDYVLRDAYMCGVAAGPVDLSRLMHYTFCTKSGLTLHKSGLPALRMFLNARSYLYSNVYNHRTTRAIDVHLRDIFPETMAEIFPDPPLKNMSAYLELTDWSLLLTVGTWEQSPSSKKKALSQEWKRILQRDVKWKMAYDTTFSFEEKAGEGATKQYHLREADLETEIRKALPVSLRQLPFRVDMATQDPRPMNPLEMGDRQIYVYNPSSQSVSKEALMEFIDTLPGTLTQCRIFAESHDYDVLLSQAAAEALKLFL